MPGTIVVGLQWGDEGKGKIIDILASQADMVVRSQGGNNAGHTVVNGGEVYKLHLVPSGILYKDKDCLIGAGVVIDPPGLLEEIDGMESRGVSSARLKIDPRAHVVMPWHLLLDALGEEARGAGDIGTTRRGIGPCYMDKYERIGLRIYDLVRPEIFRVKAARTGLIKNNIIAKIYNHPPLDPDEIIEKYIACGQRLASYVADVSVLSYEALKAGKNVLFEGAQACLLDIDMGTYPYVTSSHPIAGGVCTGVGIGPTMINKVVGVVKAYTTRVGKGPFPTELDSETGEFIRRQGGEYGTTTGRPRRTGWFDALIVRHGIRINGLTELVINKLDPLSGLKGIKVCVAYKKPDGSLINDYPAAVEDIFGCTPVYEVLPGFSGDISRCKSYADLPKACRDYVEYIEKLCACPVSMVGVGASRENVLVKP
ncbi:MAG: adenylosuccinate synthase [Oscillospiraceae bacterium]|jgi:adenylosuccinate synthase|nr:adenylosuccinate synthase [Oscillospiraceae bacterium]